MEKPKLIMICGSWGSGTSIVAKIVDEIGILTDKPCLKIKDSKTINSYESVRFRKVIQDILDEETLQLKVDNKQAINLLTEYRDALLKDLYNKNNNRPIYIKYPLACLLIELLDKLFDLKLIYVLRSIKDIEKSRVRRGWSNKKLGSEGALAIYGKLFQIMLNKDIPTVLIKYDELRKNPEIFIRQILALSGENKNKDEIENLIKLIK